ncbi:hypothetical protein SHVI106290_18980 [Shewanella violacea]
MPYALKTQIVTQGNTLFPKPHFDTFICIYLTANLAETSLNHNKPKEKDARINP